jgi:hypothetical protein
VPPRRLLPQAQRGSGGERATVVAVRAEVWRHEPPQGEQQQLLVRKLSSSLAAAQQQLQLEEDGGRRSTLPGCRLAAAWLLLRLPSRSAQACRPAIPSCQLHSAADAAHGRPCRRRQPARHSALGGQRRRRARRAARHPRYRQVRPHSGAPPALAGWLAGWLGRRRWLGRPPARSWRRGPPPGPTPGPCPPPMTCGAPSCALARMVTLPAGAASP